MPPFKSDLTFDDLLRAGLGVPLQDAPQSDTEQSDEKKKEQDEG